MKITLLQRDIEWAAPATNIARANERLDTLPPADLYVLPEMFSTGFCTDPKGIAEPLENDSIAWMKRTAAERDCALAGSIATEENGKYYNRFHFVYPDGNVKSYDKHHLFTYGGEHLNFTAGQERVIVEWKGVRILLQICYDLRFPVFARNRNDYDLILYIASWPTPRVAAWNTLLHARAIENQCYVAGVNRVGSDPNCQYSGGTFLIDPYGRDLAACPDSIESEISGEIDLAALKAFRTKFPVLNDADKFEIL
ncbi:MAG: amidohydrolase [Phocaeicola sp.]